MNLHCLINNAIPKMFAYATLFDKKSTLPMKD